MSGYMVMGFLGALVAGFAFKWKIIRWLVINLILVGAIFLAAGWYLSKYWEVDYTSGMGEALPIIFIVAAGNILGAIIRATMDRAREAKKDENSSR